FTGRVAEGSSLIPIGTTGTNDLGASALPWDNLYVDNIYSPSTGVSGYFQRNSGSLSPTNITDDLLLGGTSTSSAKFAFLNMAGGTPTASISGNLSLAVPTTAGANTFNLLNNSTLNFQRSSGGDAGLTSALFMQSNGNIGIGTTAPTSKLEVRGSNNNQVKISYDETNYMTLSATSLGDGWISPSTGFTYFYDGTSTENVGIYNGATQAILFNSGGNSFFNSGNVGIGTTSPIGLLNVTGESVGKALVNLNYTGTGENIFTASASGTTKFTLDASGNASLAGTLITSTIKPPTGALNLQYKSGGNAWGNALTVADNTGYVGIGTTSPSTLLEVYGSSQNIRISNTSETEAGINLIDAQDANQYANIYFNSNSTSPNNLLSFYVDSGTAIMTMTGSGNVGIGTTNPLEILGVTGNASISGTLAVNTIKPLTGALNLQYKSGGNAWSDALTILDNTGYVGIGTTTPGSLLSLANNGWLSGLSTSSGVVNMFKVNTADQIQVGGSLSIDGSLIFPTDGGFITAADMPFASAGNGTTNGYVFRMGTSNIMTIYGENSSGSLANGRVGIGTTAPLFGFDARNSQSATAAAQIYNTSTGTDADGLIVKLGFTGAGTATNSFATFLNGNGLIQGMIKSNASSGVTYQTNGIADFAEYFRKDANHDIPFGSAVCFDANGLAVKCSSDNKNIIGVASEHPAFLGGENLGNKSISVGLVGQVKTRVSTANGAIKIGDPLTTSSTPGVVVKATQMGQIVGKAIEAYSGEGEGQILASVNISWYNPSIQISYDGTLEGITNSVMTLEEQLALQGLALQAQIDSNAAAVASSSASAAFIIENDPLFKELKNNVDNFQSKIDLLTAQVQQQASASAFLTDIINSQVLGIASVIDASGSASLIESFGDVEIDSATVAQDLMVLGRTIVSDLGVTGNINAGVLAIHGLDGEINTLSGDLFLQKDGLGGVDILNGKIVIDTKGNMTVAGTITADAIEANNYTVLGEQSIGSATIPAGLTSIEISTSVASTSSKIFLTTTSLTDKQITVVQKTDGKFKVAIPAPTTKPISFDWWIVGNKN
ncbi:MAG: hypothetical protein U1E54_00735, partial [Candidatus Levybacteria bacterium]|nr:hypothetical protein [Candidatus Levybacteria bacterium]